MKRNNAIGHQEFWGITTFFNPQKYKNKYQNYTRFRDGTKKQGLKLLAVECAFGDQPFELTENDADILIQVRSNSILWQKERLLNIGLKNLPRNCEIFAWLDCDLIFLNNDWIQDTQRLLKTHKVVQLFEYAVRLKKGTKIEKLDINKLEYGNLENQKQESLAKNLVTKSDIKHYGAPGFGWAARKEIFEEEGFYDRMIIGSSDDLMAKSLFDVQLPSFIEAHMTESRSHWKEKMYDQVNGNVKYVSGYVLHLWHGDIKNRLYAHRHQMLYAIGFDEDTDITLNQDECWEWNTQNQKLIDFVRDYFGMRDEEGSTVKIIRGLPRKIYTQLFDIQNLKGWTGPIIYKISPGLYDTLRTHSLRLQETYRHIRSVDYKKNRKIHLITCIGVDFDRDYIPHFIQYYKKFTEIYSFNFILQTNIEDNQALQEAKDVILSFLPKAKIIFWKEVFFAEPKAEEINKIIRKRKKDWHLVVDVDEFVAFDDNSIRQTIKNKKSLVIFGKFVDRVAEDGKPKQLKPDEDIFVQFPRTVQYTQEIGGVVYKPILFRNQTLYKYLHNTDKYTYHEIQTKNLPVIDFYHFKWILNTKEKLQRRKAEYKKRGYKWYTQSENALKKYYE